MMSKDANPIRSMLFFCATGLGNIVLFLPTYHILRSRFPNAKITVLLDSRWYGDPFFRQQFSDDVDFVKFPASDTNLRETLYAIRPLRKERFDLALMPYSGHSKRQGLLMLGFGGRRTIFFETGNRLLDGRFDLILPVRSGEHYLKRNLRQAGSLGINGKIPDRWIIVEKDDIDIQRVGKGNEIWIGIHPGGNSSFNPVRQWPLSYFDELLDRVTEMSGTKVFLFGRGEDERKSIEYLTGNRGSNCLPVVDLPLSEASACIAACDLFVGNDSGIMNLAVGLGVPTVGILGPTDPKHTGPYGEMHRIARLDLPCSPCYDQGESMRCLHQICLNGLVPENVWVVMSELLASSGNRFVMTRNHARTGVSRG